MKILEITCHLTEILKEPVDHTSNSTAVNYFNNLYGNRINKGHTNVMGTTEMYTNGTMVLRILDSSGCFQYHIHTNGKVSGDRNEGSEVNKRIGIACMNIIFHDAKFYLLRDKPVKILAPNHEMFSLYKRIAQRLIDEIPNKQVVITDIGTEPDSDGNPLEAFKIWEPPKRKLPEIYIPLGN